MKQVKKVITTFICFLLLTASQMLYAQVGKVIKGVVVDESDLPVIGANVIEKGASGNGTITDLDGKFALTLSKEKSCIVISYIGYGNKVITVDNKSFFNIKLSEDKQLLDEVVVVGYGVQKKKLLTGATSQVSNKDLMNLSSSGIMGALQSKIPGANISKTSGMPGSASNIVIRGLGTMGNSGPLYVIDGVAGADIALLSPSDIASVDILKDAASAAIYGSRAANGVILITTKEGKEGKVSISYDGYYGVQNVAKKVDMLNGQEYMMMQDERLRNASDGKQQGYDWAKLLPSDLLASLNSGDWKGVDWFKEIENENAPMQNHSVSLTGGSKHSKFSAGYSYTSQEGILGKPVTPNYEKHNARIRATNVLLANDKFDVITINTNLIYSFVQNQGISVGDIFNNDIKSVMIAPPVLPVYNEEGEYYDTKDKRKNGWNFDKFAYNPIGQMVDRNHMMNKLHRLFANAYIEVQPLLNLKLKSAFGYKLLSKSTRKFIAQYDYAEVNSNAHEKITQGGDINFSWTWENTLSYHHTYCNNHTIDLVLGQSLERQGIGESMSATNSNLIFEPDFDYAWLSNTKGVDPQYTSVSGSPKVRNMLASFFGRINYNYDETYMFSAMLRADGSSAFNEGKRWGYFPSFSAGWVMSNESFMSSTKNWLNFLKVRASWGQNGNCNIPMFQYLGTIAYPASLVYYFTDDKMSQSQGAYADIMPNADITWETSEQLDLGIDAYFFKSRLGVNFDWYQKTTRDWLVKAPILGSYGTGAPYKNGGEITNNGVELGLNWNSSVGKLNYGVHLNGSYNVNEVTKIANAEGIIYGKDEVLDNATDYFYMAQVGKPIGFFYGFKTDGIFQNQKQVNETQAKVPDAAPGDLIFVDVNNDGRITDSDRTMIGNPYPDLLASLSFNLEYKGFDFALTSNGAFGQEVVQSYRPQVNKLYYNYTKDMLNERWHGEGTSNTFPRLGKAGNFNKISDLYVKNADYFRIQNITLGYDFNKILRKSSFQKLRLYLSLQNYFTFTSYDGFDPAVGYGAGDSWASGIDLGYYPSAKSIIVGASIKF